jgi:hypothetical protein
MKGVQVELPECASAMLADLQAARDSALDSSRSAQQRLNQLADADTDPRLRDRVAAEQSKHTLRYNQLHRLVSEVNQWLVQLRLAPGFVLAPAPPLDINSRRAAPLPTPANAVAGMREDIANVKREMAAVRAAPLKRNSQREAAVAHLSNLARRVRPRISFDARGVARIGWAEDMVVDKSEVLGMIVWALGPENFKCFERALDLDAGPEPENAISQAEREQQLDKLATTLLTLERQEEFHINRAAADGMEILRRPDASPLAVLGIAIVAQEAEAAVA